MTLTNADLDRWLAEHLMEWHELVDPEVPHPKVIEYRNGPAHDGPCEVYQYDVVYEGDLLVSSCPYVSFDSWGDIEWVPSERIWHAKDVWEKMRKRKGFSFEVRDSGMFGVRFGSYPWQIADTIEMAVCLAAKITLETLEAING